MRDVTATVFGIKSSRTSIISGTWWFSLDRSAKVPQVWICKVKNNYQPQVLAVIYVNLNILSFMVIVEGILTSKGETYIRERLELHISSVTR